jgi:ubiquinone/menaquinone biosynthesis C-methylase UbiE
VNNLTEEKQKRQVREGYARIATSQSSCCGGSSRPYEESKKIGYSKEELESVPESSNMGLGCGNPTALSSLEEGEIVVDLGSGGGFDCFLAARKVGQRGKVIGVDMTPEMIDKARENARKGKYGNVEFRLGEIENLPVADNTADVVISNCVINLAPDKKRVFQEAFRVLKPEGRLMVSDLVLLKELSDALRRNMDSTSCVAGAMLKDKYIEAIKAAGFKSVRIVDEKQYHSEDFADDPDAEVMTFNPKTNATETKKVSELDDKAKQRMKEILETTMSISVSATKPSK